MAWRATVCALVGLLAVGAVLDHPDAATIFGAAGFGLACLTAALRR